MLFRLAQGLPKLQAVKFSLAWIMTEERRMGKILSRLLVAFIAGSVATAPALATAIASNDSAQTPSQRDNRNHFHYRLPSTLQVASRPSKFFFGPTARVLNSMEISFSGGSSFGVEESGGLLARCGLGLGGVAEMEFSTTQVVNQLTGKETRFPARTFKVNLMPARFAERPLVPTIAAQLRTTSWGSVVEREYAVARAVQEDYAKNYSNMRLDGLSLQTRFTTLHLVAGKEGQLGGIHLGFSLTDVRTKGGGQWVLDEQTFMYAYHSIPAKQKNLLDPFGGAFINANETTQVMAEVGVVPSFRYNVLEKTIDITKAWAGIAGVRFFMAKWVSWDVGVRYLDTYAGIADAEISMALNLILPLKRVSKE